MPDEMRLQRVGVETVLAGQPAILLARRIMLQPWFDGLFYYISSVVVSRFTLHARTRKTGVGGFRGSLSRERERPKSRCGSPAQKGRCVNPRRRCGVPELPGELINGQESWPRSSCSRSQLRCAVAQRVIVALDPQDTTPTPSEERGDGEKEWGGCVWLLLFMEAVCVVRIVARRW